MSDQKIKKILIMGGKPIASCDIVNYANSINVYTIVTDNLEPKKSPAKLIAKEHWMISTADIELLHDKMIENGVDAIFTGAHEFNIKMTLELANKANVPFYMTTEQFAYTSQKNVYKKLFKDSGLPVVQEYSSLDITNVEYPVLIKPVDGGGGYGISICNNVNDLKKASKKAKNHSSTREILIEKYITKKEVTIFYIIQNGNIYLSAMADRITQQFDKDYIPLPIAYLFPSVHLRNFIENQNQTTIEAFKSIGLKNGMLFIQAFVDDDKFIYYDIGFRLTGTQEYNILEYTNKFNPLKMLVDYSLSEKMGLIDIRNLVDPYLNKKHACIITFLALNGKIGKIKGVDLIEKFRGVIKVVINHGVGESIPISALGTLNQVVCRVFSVVNKKSDMLKVIDYAIDNFNVYDENNNSILIKTERNLI